MKIYTFIIYLCFTAGLCAQTDYDLDIVLPREIKKMDSLIEIEPTAEHFFYRGHFKFKSKLYNQALIDFDHCIALSPNNSEYYYNRGVAKEKMKSFDAAIIDFNTSIRIDNNIKAYLNRAYCKAETKDLEGALIDYDFYLKSSPLNANALYNRGMVKSNQKLYTDAIKDFDQAIKIEPANSEFLHSRAITRAVLGRKDALDDFNRAIQLNANNPDIYINRAVYYLNANSKGDYCADLRKAVSLGAQEAKALLQTHCK